jgi:beta-phosphoglucomutase-like phosphatase (HAD superfamily)
MAALLLRLKAEGVPFAVASNSQMDRLEIKLRKVGLYDLFAPHIYSRDHVAHAKPAPDMYQYAAARLGVDPADCVVVEDSAPGLTAGVAAGCHVIGFTGNYLDPDLAAVFLQAAGAAETAATVDRLTERVAALLGLPPERLLPLSPPGAAPSAPAP